MYEADKWIKKITNLVSLTDILLWLQTKFWSIMQDRSNDSFRLFSTSGLPKCTQNKYIHKNLPSLQSIQEKVIIVSRQHGTQRIPGLFWYNKRKTSYAYWWLKSEHHYKSFISSVPVHYVHSQFCSLAKCYGTLKFQTPFCIKTRHNITRHFHLCDTGQDSSVGIVTHYGLDSPRIESW